MGGYCFFLSALEYLIPKPLPFIRLGLANIPLLIALDIMPFSSFALLGFLKIIGQALISGTLFSYVFLFSLGGTGVSALFMYALRRQLGEKRISLIGVSAAGAFASNGIQLVLAYFFVFGKSIIYAAAPILGLGVVTGTLLGIFSEYFIRHSRWYARLKDPGIKDPEIEDAPDGIAAIQSEFTVKAHDAHEEEKKPAFRALRNFPVRFRKTRETFCLETFSSGALAVAGLCMIPALLLNPDTNTRVIQFLFFWFLAWLSGKKNNPFITVSVMLGIVLFNLLVPYGEVIYSIGPLKITSGALQGGVRRAVTLEGLFMLSRCCVRRDLRLPGIFGKIVGESFRIFSRLAEEKKLLSRENWIGRLDGLLVSYGEGAFPAGKNQQPLNANEKPEITGETPVPPVRTFAQRIILPVGIIFAWLPLLWQFRAFLRR